MHQQQQELQAIAGRGARDVRNTSSRKDVNSRRGGKSRNSRNIYRKSPAQLLTHTSPTWSYLLQLIMRH